MTEPIEWDIDANLPLYTRDWLRGDFILAYRVDGKLYHPEDVEVVRNGGANPVPRLPPEVTHGGIQALNKAWFVRARGGEWDILTLDGDIIAVDIPFGAYAEHIVQMHNHFRQVEAHVRERTT